MNRHSLLFKKFIWYRVIPQRCPTHNKSPRISVNGMVYKITYCCCESFHKDVEARCCKYKYGILSGRYNFSPRSRLM